MLEKHINNCFGLISDLIEENQRFITWRSIVIKSRSTLTHISSTLDHNCYMN